MSQAGSLSVSDVVRLATVLAQQILGAGETDSALTEDEISALVKAARFLDDNGVPWPSVVEQAIEMLAEHMESVRAAPGGAEVAARSPQMQ